jgi:arylesterase / paraoxonase
MTADERSRPVWSARVAAAGVALLLAACGAIPPAGRVETARWSDLSCTAVRVPPGPEDIEIDQAEGIAYVASTHRRVVLAGTALGDGRVGEISRLDLKVKTPTAEKITPPALQTPTFQPHGMGLYVGPDGVRRLFVVDQEPRWDAGRRRWDTCHVTQRIEILRVTPEGLDREEPVTGAALSSPNDVAGVGPRSFYVTNDHEDGPCDGQQTSDILGFRDCNVQFYDGTRFHRVAGDLGFANGIVVDEATKRVYVAATTEGVIYAYGWSEAHPVRPGAMPLVRLGSGPDNLSIGPDGDLYVAGLPSLTHAFAYSHGNARTAPSQVIVVNDPDGTSPRGVEIFRDQEGHRIAGATAAAAYDWREAGVLRLVIGSLFDDHVLICDRPSLAN